MLQNIISNSWAPLVSPEGWDPCLLYFYVNMHLRDLVYQMYLNRKVHWETSRWMTVQLKNNSDTFIKVERQGAQNEPRVKLLERPLKKYMAAWLRKKWEDTHYTDFYTRRNLTNDIGKYLCHLPDIPYDAFHITA